MIIVVFTGFCTPDQSKILNYKIVQNNNVIGWMRLEKRDSMNTCRIILNSETKKRLIFLFTIYKLSKRFLKMEL